MEDVIVNMYDYHQILRDSDENEEEKVELNLSLRESDEEEEDSDKRDDNKIIEVKLEDHLMLEKKIMVSRITDRNCIVYFILFKSKRDL